MVIGLRHDLDEVYGLRWGSPKVISVEKKYGVRSAFFVRTILYVVIEVVACYAIFYLVPFGYVLAVDVAGGMGD